MQTDRLRRSSWGALALLALLPVAARSATAESPPPRRIQVAPPLRGEADSDAGNGFETDDPRARWQAQDALGLHTGAEARWKILEEARRERDRIGPSSPPPSSAASGRSAAASRVPGTAWINLGPTRADFEDNGGRYIAEDSGRARNILTHPSNPNILYMATAGGGVWKSYDGGAGWEPLTDRLGTTSVGTLAMDPSNPEILILGFGDPFDVQTPGLVRSLDGGATWSDPVFLKGTYQVSGAAQTRTATSVRDIKVDPLNSLHLIAATDAGLFVSNDQGATWTLAPLHDATGGTAAFFQMWSLGWVGPKTWLASGQGLDLSAVAAGNPAVDHHAGLFRSIDDGVTWTWLVNKLPAADQAIVGRTTLAVSQSTTDSADTARVFLLAANVDGSAQQDVYRSEDGGQTWVSLKVNAQGRPTNPVFAPGEPGFDQRDLDVMHRQAWYNQAILADPTNPNAVYVGGNLTMVRSLDGGQTWSIISEWLPFAYNVTLAYVHADFHALALGIDGSLYAGSDGGIFKSTLPQAADPAAVAFSLTLNEGLVTHLIFSVACALDSWPTALQGFVFGGLQDNGSRLRVLDPSPTTTFNQVLGGDGIGVSVSSSLNAAKTAPAIIMASTPGRVARSTDGGATFTRFETGLQGPIPFFVRFAHDTAAIDPATFLTFTDSGGSVTAQVLRSVAGGSWTNISGNLHWPKGQTTLGFQTPDSPPKQIGIHTLAAHPAVTGLYAAASNKFTYVTIDNGVNWTVGNQPMPSGSTAGTFDSTSIAFDPSDTSGQTIYLTQGAVVLDDGVTPVPDSFGHLLKSTDQGLTWTSLTGSGGTRLPNVPVQKIALDPSNPSTLYAGTDLGLYRSIDGGSSFQRFGTGLPLVKVTDVCIAPASGVMTVSTFGRGFWSLDIGAAGNPAGVRGKGDLNYDLRVDGFDLIDLVGAMGTTQASDGYRAEADLVGNLNAIDDADLTALLAKFGGQP